MNLMQRFMRVFFNLLYHSFAFTYDLVAAAVSFGKWKDWVFSIIPFIEGTHILELGHGPGHLQRILLDRGLGSVAIDESAPMGTLAKRRLGNFHRLTRALSQSLPFADESFDSVVATFPTEYIFNPHTLSEVKRVLRSGGRLIVLPTTFPKSKFLKWLYKITGESPKQFDESIKSNLKTPFINAEFQTEIQILDVKSSHLLVVVANKIYK